MEGLKVSDTDLVLYLPPSKSNKISQAILRELSSLLFKYMELIDLKHDYVVCYETIVGVDTVIHGINAHRFSEIFEGVVLAYDVNILEKNGKILSGIHPYFGVRLKAKLLLFSPRPNMLLEGKVVKLTEESIHVIVLGFSSAIIIDEDIREEFNYKTKHGEEVFASRLHKWHVIKVGTVIRFFVKSFDEEILHISGSLIPSHTGSIRWLDKKSENVSLIDSRKRRKGEGETEMQDNQTVGGGVSSLSSDHQMTKSKKHRFAEEY